MALRGVSSAAYCARCYACDPLRSSPVDSAANIGSLTDLCHWASSEAKVWRWRTYLCRSSTNVAATASSGIASPRPLMARASTGSQGDNVGVPLRVCAEEPGIYAL